MAHVNKQKLDLAELSKETYNQEAHITEAYSPLVIDAGSDHYDQAGNYDSNACGWLAVHAALHYSYYIGKLPERLLGAFKNHDLLPPKLKSMSGHVAPHERMTDANLRTLSDNLGIRITVYEKGAPTAYGDRLDFGVRLWLSQYHYTALIALKDDVGEHAERVVGFASRFPRLRYEAKQLVPLTAENYDRQLAASEIAADDATLAKALAVQYQIEEKYRGRK
jgi:hypothetical protein